MKGNSQIVLQMAKWLHSGVFHGDHTSGLFHHYLKYQLGFEMGLSWLWAYGYKLSRNVNKN